MVRLSRVLSKRGPSVQSVHSMSILDVTVMLVLCSSRLGWRHSFWTRECWVHGLKDHNSSQDFQSRFQLNQTSVMARRCQDRSERGPSVESIHSITIIVFTVLFFVWGSKCVWPHSFWTREWCVHGLKGHKGSQDVRTSVKSKSNIFHGEAKPSLF